MRTLSLRLLLLLLPCTAFSQVDYDDLDYKESAELFYYKGEPYTGRYYQKSSGGNNSLELTMDLQAGYIYNYQMKLTYKNHLLSEVEYHNTNQKGWMKIYYPNGQKHEQYDYINGYSDKVQKWFPSGQLKYVDEGDDSTWKSTEYFANGNKKCESFVLNNQVTTLEWDSTGVMLPESKESKKSKRGREDFGGWLGIIGGELEFNRKKLHSFNFYTDTIKAGVGLYNNGSVREIECWDTTAFLSRYWYTNGQIAFETEIDLVNKTGSYKEWRPGGGLAMNETMQCEMTEIDDCIPEDWLLTASPFYFIPEIKRWRKREDYLR